jgi:hypothetical protein
MMLLRPAIGLLTWYAYSAAQRTAVKRNSYASMLLVSELRRPDGGDMEKLRSVADQLPAATMDTIPDSWVPLPFPLSPTGSVIDDSEAPAATATASARSDSSSRMYSSIRTTKDIAVAYHNQSTEHDTKSLSSSSSSSSTSVEPLSVSLFARDTHRMPLTDAAAPSTQSQSQSQPQSPSQVSLAQLVSQRTTQSFVVEDVYERLRWMDAVDKCVPAVSSLPAVVSDSDAALLLQNKIYTFCFRDYVTNEELNSIMARRWGIGRLLLRARRCGQLSVDSVNKCHLTEWFALGGILPIRVEWRGEIRDHNSAQTDDGAIAAANTNAPAPAAIHWTSTSLRVGWNNALGKTVANPPVSEKLRQEPWAIYLPVDGNGDIVVLHRLGSGKLVYATDECMK